MYYTHCVLCIKCIYELNVIFEACVFCQCTSMENSFTELKTPVYLLAKKRFLQYACLQEWKYALETKMFSVLDSDSHSVGINIQFIYRPEVRHNLFGVCKLVIGILPIILIIRILFIFYVQDNFE